jgi:hypothetical protein
MLQRQYGAVPPAVEQRRGEAVELENALARQGATVQAFADHAVPILGLQRIGELQIGDVVEGYRCKVFPCVVAEAEVPAVDHQAGPPAAVRGPHGVHAVSIDGIAPSGVYSTAMPVPTPSNSLAQR